MTAQLLRTRADTPTPTRAPAETGWLPMLVVLAGTFVTFLDFFIVNVGLPSIGHELHAGPSAVSLVVAGYGLTFAVFMITGGRLGDIYGRRRMFVLGLALFTITSLACGVAPSAGVLVTARVLQGAAGALLTPQVLAILGTAYAGARRDTAFAAYGFAMGIAAVLGQLIGGALIQADVAGLGWRSIFLINVPVGLIGVPLARRVVPESRGAESRLDLVGTLLGTIALVALVLPLVEGREHGWPVWCWASFVVAAVVGAAFVAHQRRRAAAGRHPLLPPTLFTSRRFVAGLLTTVTFSLVPPSFFFVLALYLQQGRGFGALFSGVVFVAVGAGYFGALFLANPLARRWGHQVLAVGAAGVAVGGVLVVAAARASSSRELVPGLALVGFGIGLVLVPLASTVLRDVAPEHAGSAAGVLASVQQVGAALGVAGIGMVFFAGTAVVAAFTVCVWVLVGAVALSAGVAQLLR